MQRRDLPRPAGPSTTSREIPWAAKGRPRSALACPACAPTWRWPLGLPVSGEHAGMRGSERAARFRQGRALCWVRGDRTSKPAGRGARGSAKPRGPHLPAGRSSARLRGRCRDPLRTSGPCGPGGGDSSHRAEGLRQDPVPRFAALFVLCCQVLQYSH
nr:uncharacterized protein LOC114101585 [Marmota flaviventris]